MSLFLLLLHMRFANSMLGNFSQNFVIFLFLKLTFQEYHQSVKQFVSRSGLCFFTVFCDLPCISLIENLETWLWYLIVSIPDLCTLTYFDLSLCVYNFSHISHLNNKLKMFIRCTLTIDSLLNIDSSRYPGTIRQELKQDLVEKRSYKWFMEKSRSHETPSKAGATLQQRYNDLPTYWCGLYLRSSVVHVVVL